ncbi:cell division protein ZapE [Zooshikella ganghwensis]|uniref:Cell division protein ZapE n=1 Tax=Zooshikella ganghwensis TaxID=202772 RepID=A0A4P9VPP6_9GAMM|nr:cell division protein ZapE [Zooshikella ganghwensis]RDH45443.1 cell division protein ZapE [Zooshikella ganghwensis]
MSPIERYQRDLQREDFLYDAAQEQAVKHLQRLYEALQSASIRPAKRSWLFFRTKKVEAPIKGLYFWGGVGRGKTYLVDTFFESLTTQQKWRTHFHRFMMRVHQELKAIPGEKNPLEQVAQKLSADFRIICLDEFFVTDITDAMILAGLLQQLFARGVTLVATSNIVPDDLYKDGLQRQRFLPAIELLKTHTEVVNVDSGIDYRLRVLEQAEIYHYPLDKQAKQQLTENFKNLSVLGEGNIVEDATLEILGRDIPFKKLCDGIVWFSFAQLCDGPRSQNDYIEISRQFHTVLLDEIPQLTAKDDDLARRFINLIDEFYDRNVNVIMSAAVAVTELYQGQNLSFPFKRTVSRLQEMQSHEYLARPHQA